MNKQVIEIIQEEVWEGCEVLVLDIILLNIMVIQLTAPRSSPIWCMLGRTLLVLAWRCGQSCRVVLTSVVLRLWRL